MLVRGSVPIEGFGTVSPASSLPPFCGVDGCAGWVADWAVDEGIFSMSLRASAVSGVYSGDSDLGGVALTVTEALGSKPIPSYTIVGGFPSFHPCTFHSALWAALIIEFGTYLSHL